MRQSHSNNGSPGCPILAQTAWLECNGNFTSREASPSYNCEYWFWCVIRRRACHLRQVGIHHATKAKRLSAACIRCSCMHARVLPLTNAVEQQRAPPGKRSAPESDLGVHETRRQCAVTHTHVAERLNGPRATARWHAFAGASHSHVSRAAHNVSWSPRGRATFR